MIYITSYLAVQTLLNTTIMLGTMKAHIFLKYT